MRGVPLERKHCHHHCHHKLPQLLQPQTATTTATSCSEPVLSITEAVPPPPAPQPTPPLPPPATSATTTSSPTTYATTTTTGHQCHHHHRPPVPPPPRKEGRPEALSTMHLATTTLASLLVLVVSNPGFANPEPGRSRAQQDAAGRSRAQQDAAGRSRNKEGSSSWSPPEFNEALANNITVMEGETAALPCVVTRLRGRSVSWMRQRDLHVISANQLIFTSDDRFKVRMDNETSSFTLEVGAALTNDSGVYECQINTRPKLSRPVTLTVQAAGAYIVGPSELYIKTGSTLVLTCTATLHPHAHTKVGWEHNGTRLSISGPRGGVSIHTEAGGRVVTSRVSVVRAAPPDAGNYTCHPHAALPATTTVFIVDEQFPAAMHHESGAGLPWPASPTILLNLLLLAAR